jgi:peptidyl-dipeptidase A
MMKAIVTAAIVAATSMTVGVRAESVATSPRENADEFIARINAELTERSLELNLAGFVYATYINADTEKLNAMANERYLEYFSSAVKQARAFEGKPLSPQHQRALRLLKLGLSAPAPDDPAKRAELARVSSKMEGMYGSAKYCPEGPTSCKDQTALVEVMAHSRNYDELLDAWTGWHNTARPMRSDYVRFVELANEGARELGFDDVGAMWRSGYDMPPQDFAREVNRLYAQVEPLYKSLHCYVRGRLQRAYGADRVPSGRPIPAHLLGNLWAQNWGQIYDLVEPYPGVAQVDVTTALQEQQYDAVRITRSAEDFYVSLGFPKLPQTFWERSMLTKPRDREVQCHASAWHMDDKADVRIKQCIEPTQVELETVYHELGHVFYYLSYQHQPHLFQGGAHDGFHEAIGDTVNLSMTPSYLHRIGLLSEVKTSKEAIINQQMRLALDKIAFLPFGKVIDEWRWKVFAGEIAPANYNKAWWDLRREYQGIEPAVRRTESDFDPGAKYHIPANTPYTRYFLSFILQFQFHRALCEAAGFKGPLHECSIYGNTEAGKRLREMLALGQSQPWQDTLYTLTRTREMDASAIIDYFAPLMKWLKQQNRNQQCGW